MQKPQKRYRNRWNDLKIVIETKIIECVSFVFSFFFVLRCCYWSCGVYVLCVERLTVSPRVDQNQWKSLIKTTTHKNPSTHIHTETNHIYTNTIWFYSLSLSLFCLFSFSSSAYPPSRLIIILLGTISLSYSKTKTNDKRLEDYGIETSTRDLKHLSNLSISNLRTTTPNIGTTSTSPNPSSHNHKSTDDYCLFKYNEPSDCNHLCKDPNKTKKKKQKKKKQNIHNSQNPFWIIPFLFFLFFPTQFILFCELWDMILWISVFVPICACVLYSLCVCVCVFRSLLNLFLF